MSVDLSFGAWDQVPTANGFYRAAPLYFYCCVC